MDNMKELGFTDHREGWWYRNYVLDDNVTLNLSLNKETGEWTEDVLNEMFGQPEFYGYAIPEWRDEIVAKIDRIIDTLKSQGLPFEVDHRQYGHRPEKGENNVE
jgi:hypothetical protein